MNPWNDDECMVIIPCSHSLRDVDQCATTKISSLITTSTYHSKQNKLCTFFNF